MIIVKLFLLVTWITTKYRISPFIFLRAINNDKNKIKNEVSGIAQFSINMNYIYSQNNLGCKNWLQFRKVSARGRARYHSVPQALYNDLPGRTFCKPSTWLLRLEEVNKYTFARVCQALGIYTRNSRLVWDYSKALLNLANTNKITLIWVSCVKCNFTAALRDLRLNRLQ